jgi:ribosomal protein S18 acetylase RimI-like enzyme
LYDFAAVSLEHQQEMFNSDEYGHLVVVDPTGLFVAYCEYSICRAEWQQSGKQLGWIDYIGTRPENRQQGLGRAVLLASLHRLQALGAKTVMLVTISTNNPAIKLYETTGFARMDVPEAPNYEKQVVAN